jgi:hypothetical protein
VVRRRFRKPAAPRVDGVRILRVGGLRCLGWR